MQDLDHDDQLPPREFFTEFKLSDAWDETKDEFRYGTVKSKATSSAKLIGKSLWNLGLHVAKNLPEQLEKARADIEKKNEARMKTKEIFERKLNGELYEIAKNSGDNVERRVAYDILRARKAEHDANKA
ncbi:hypothetical protein PSCT_03074 [Pseudomonas sp. SCT]|uniref:hypothetical protein n=1 Tax=Pseudomonas sp. (strain SCT) TaxID=412955 RepID=UPI000ED5EF23|nr:hypothetical protein [Pseudomonas sp. SCT]GCA56865.1 hypothetical protein PSCT_03074 [Pseudomonas sp. SCT]